MARKIRTLNEEKRVNDLFESAIRGFKPEFGNVQHIRLNEIVGRINAAKSQVARGNRGSYAKTVYDEQLKAINLLEYLKGLEKQK